MKQIKAYFLNEWFILSIIILNSIIIFIQQFGIETIALEVLDTFFTLLFMVEAIIKIRTYSWKNYKADSWNRFDFVLVLVSIPSIAVLFVSFHIFDLSFLLVLRSLRVFKAFRLIKFLPEIEDLVRSVKRALKTSYVVGLGFFILVFIFSLVSSALYREIAPEYFGNPMQSIYTVFQLFSVEGWYEIPNLIAGRSSETVAFFTKIYFSFLLLGGGILGLSLVNSIFVDAMVADNNDSLEEEIKKLTEKIDKLTEEIKMK